MPDTVSKTDNFLKAIEKYAEQQRGRMQSEAEEFKERELNTAEEEGMRDAYLMIQKTMADINNSIASETSRTIAAGKKSVFARRQQIEDEIFAKAEQKLLAFTQSDKYLSWLTRRAAEISRVLNAGDVVLYVRESDLKYQKKLWDYFGQNCQIQPSETIRIGGIKGHSPAMGLVADETLDTRLDQQREWFYEHSGLTVTES